MAEAPPKPPLTSAEYRYSSNLADVLQQLNVSLLVSTYQAGKIFTVGTYQGALDFHFHHFDQAMGLARLPNGLAVGSRRQIWSLIGMRDLAPKIAPEGKYDVVFLTRSAHYTGPVMGHEMAWAGGQLWFVNTLFSCLCTLDPNYNFVPKWKPPFVTALTSEDRCHLNGLAIEGERPRYVTLLGETDTAGGWRANKAAGGCLLDVVSNEVVLRGLCMPHSPRVHNGEVYLLDSGHGRLCRVDLRTRSLTTVAELNGYTRGMDLLGPFAFVGLSRIRETSVFGGLPIGERRDELRCGVTIVDLRSGQIVAFLHFLSGVEEIFEVKVLPGFRTPIISGPLPDVDQTETIWLAPPLAV